jgi:hypothetical protein
MNHWPSLFPSSVSLGMERKETKAGTLTYYIETYLLNTVPALFLNAIELNLCDFQPRSMQAGQFPGRCIPA